MKINSKSKIEPSCKDDDDAKSTLRYYYRKTEDNNLVKMFITSTILFYHLWNSVRFVNMNSTLKQNGVSTGVWFVVYKTKVRILMD